MSQKEPSSSLPIVNRLNGISIKGTPLNGQILRYDKNDNVFKWIGGDGIAMGDLAFIQDKILTNNWFQVEDGIDSIGESIEYVVPAGKTAFLVTARVMPIGVPNIKDMVTDSNESSSNIVSTELTIGNSFIAQFNTGTKSKVSNIGNGAGSGTSEGNIGAEHIDVRGIFLIGDGVKKIKLFYRFGQGDIIVYLSGYLIDTPINP